MPSYVAATNLLLPLRDESCDAVVSDGVIHHTPDALRAFTENVRVLKPGGHLYLACYNRHGYYYYAYSYIGVPIRWLEKRPWGRALVHATLVPVYYLVHLVKSGGKRTWRGARHFFYDYFITPRAPSIPGTRSRTGAGPLGCPCSNTIRTLGNVHAFILRKNGPLAIKQHERLAPRQLKICIVSSCGGHLTEVRCLKPAFEGYEHFYVLNDKALLPADMQGKTLFITHAERDWRILKNVWEAIAILARERPQVISEHWGRSSCAVCAGGSAVLRYTCGIRRNNHAH